MSRGAPGSSSGGARNVFLERITRLRGALRGVEERLGSVQDIVEDLVEAVGSEETSLRKALQKTMQGSHEDIQRALQELKSLRDQNEDFQGGDGEKRMRKSQIEALSSKFVELTGRVQQCEWEAISLIRKRVRKEVMAAKGAASEEEVDRVLSGKASASTAFEQQLAPADWRSTAAASTVQVEHSMAEEKLRDLHSLEADFDQLLETIRDFSALIFLQGSEVDTIAVNIMQCANFVAKGREELRTAHHHQKKSRCSVM